MKIFKYKTELQSYLLKINETNIISFVPTMGSLHIGHISLIKKAKENSDLVICSIFVNPTQFNNLEDLEKYPRSINADILLLESENTDVLYLPDTKDLYSKDEVLKQFKFNGLDNFMEGVTRKNHFNGVATIVEKLFMIIQPNLSYFGEKDLQQLQIIKYITKQLNLPVKIIGLPTVREDSGLAMSSRNNLLSNSDKKKAILIFKTLKYIKENSEKIPVLILKEKAINLFENQSELTLEYLEIVDLKNLSPITLLGSQGTNAACISASISSVRLIDNIIF